MHQQILSAIAVPDIGLLLLFVGVLGIYFEFCAPGLVAPAVLGSTLAIAGIAGLIRAAETGAIRNLDFSFALAAALMLIVVTVFLSRIALRARRNKRESATLEK